MLTAPVSRVVLGTVLILTLSRVADAACPQSTCDCLGEARQYRVVAADRVLAGVGFILEPGARFPVGTYVRGNVCAATAKLIEPASDYTEIEDGDLYVLSSAGVAVRSRITGRPSPTDAISIGGTLATGGGSIVGPVDAQAVDTSGTHPGIASCQQAISDMQAASQTLAGLAPSMTLSDIAVVDGTTYDIAAGAGANVVNVTGRITVKAQIVGTNVAPSTLRITLQPATDSVIVNAASLYVGRFCNVIVAGGDESKVVINLPGRGRAVVVKNDTLVAPVILAPERVIRVAWRGEFAGGLGRRVLLRGPFVSQTYDTCPASPSGAFLEGPGTF